ncbi:hypothetical protein K450DRAFT_221448 [Umbelopsis ramanniana AG]|uniref:Uncharacterized protein n=1 Tax=Umbelopsis ramanniana AG TaxID=1314678 RepID=A0AAD5HGH7_UMBRA|nr:uncharacterized protein K450DRAFT_221448 [Umbelopsis ramanniana AG]KAI8583485.1 hypothetical protein K450DRAFT_221448 [Umbelopsis ramanniana AG]
MKKSTDVHCWLAQYAHTYNFAFLTTLNPSIFFICTSLCAFFLKTEFVASNHSPKTYNHYV